MRKKIEMDTINADLMEAGYLCPDYSVHMYGKLSDWQDDVRYMTCEKCGKITPAMAKVNSK